MLSEKAFLVKKFKLVPDEKYEKQERDDLMYSEIVESLLIFGDAVDRFRNGGATRCRKNWSLKPKRTLTGPMKPSGFPCQTPRNRTTNRIVMGVSTTNRIGKWTTPAPKSETETKKQEN